MKCLAPLCLPGLLGQPEEGWEPGHIRRCFQRRNLFPAAATARPALMALLVASGSPFCALLLLLLAFALQEETWAEAPSAGGPTLPGPGQQRFLDKGRGGEFLLSGEGSPTTSRGTQLTAVHEPQDKTKPAWLHTPCPPDPCGQPPYCQAWLVKVTLLGVLGLLVMGGNGLAIAVLASSVSGWSHSSRFMLLSLAASDAALAVLVVPLNLYRSLELGPAAPKEAAREEAAYCRVVAFINSSLFGASLYSLAGVSLERYVAVFFPLHYGRLLSPRRVLLLITAAWLLPALLLVPLAIPAPVAVLQVRFSAAALLCEPDYGSNPFYSLWMAGTIFCPAAATIAFTNMRLWLVARSQRHRGKDAGLLGKVGRPKRLRMLQLDAAARVLLPVVFAFFVCWAPCMGTIVYNCKCSRASGWHSNTHAPSKGAGVFMPRKRAATLVLSLLWSRKTTSGGGAADGREEGGEASGDWLSTVQKGHRQL